MSGRRQTATWAVALAASLGLHGTIGMALLAMPRPSMQAPLPTEISIETLQSETARPLSSAQPVVPVAVEPADALATVAGDAPPLAASPEASEAAPVAIEPVTESTPATATQPLAAVDDIAPALDAGTLQPGQVVAASEPDAEALAAPSESQQALAAPAESQQALPAPTDAAAVPIDVEAAPAPGAPDDAEAADPIVQAEPVTPIAPAQALAPPAAAATDLARVATNDAAAAPVVDRAPVASPTEAGTALAGAVDAPRVAAVADADAFAPVRDPAAAPASSSVTSAPVAAPSAPAAVAPSAAAPAQQPALSVAPSATVLAPVAPEAAPVLSPSAEENDEVEQQVAVVVPDEPAVEAPRPARRAIALGDFLKEQEGENCLLAIPTDSAAMETFADTPAIAAALGRLYESMSGIEVRSSIRPVSAAQCGALAFSRSLAQYPNYPLRLDLASSRVGSGDMLAGRITGIRKNSLMLVVVDDEGKATLVDSFAGVTTTEIAFAAPMTLTEGPVSSVQLLIAIASDGALRTRATRPGGDADAFFAQLTDEIRSDNRPIHFGITSFVVE